MESSRSRPPWIRGLGGNISDHVSDCIHRPILIQRRSGWERHVFDLAFDSSEREPEVAAESVVGVHHSVRSIGLECDCIMTCARAGSSG